MFDANEARVTKYPPPAGDRIVFAGGLDRVVVGLPKAGVLERWSPTTFERDKAAPPPFKEGIGNLFLGHGSNGPVVANGYFLDLATFRPLPLGDGNGNGNARVWSPGHRIVAGADGTVFAAWNTHLSPSNTATFVVEGDGVRRYDGDLRHAVPGPDGRDVLTGRGVVSRTLESADGDDETLGDCLPAVRGDCFPSVRSAGGAKPGGVDVHPRGVRQPIAKFPDLDHGLTFDGWDREDLGPWKRVFLVPDAKLIVSLPAGNDQVVLHRFDPDAALRASGADYLIVSSRPPAGAVRPGATFTDPLVVESKAGAPAFKLDAAPAGMSLLRF